MDKILLLLLFSVASGQSGYKSVEYYKKIWDENVEKALKWERPTFNRDFRYDEKEKCLDNPEIYDFIIIGGGGSGAVLASRLSEITSWKILLLEAGKDETEFSLIPGAYIAVQSSDLNYGYLTVPQKKACLSMNNNQCPFSRGKALGGETALNENVYQRGNSKDFDLWEDMHNFGWDYDEVLHHFIQLENSTGILGDFNYHGYNGPLQLNYQLPESPLTQFIINAHKERGLTELDYNGKSQMGVAKIQANINFGQRQSTNQAYLQPVKYRNNLKIITEALVTKINTNNLGTKAISVSYIEPNGKCHTVYARTEILLSAGTVNSAQVLMLSGIGPKDQLKKFKIPIKQDLPVGKNLEDHICHFGVTIETNFSVPQYTIEKDLLDYSQGFGRLAGPFATEISYLKKSRDNPGYPDFAVMHTLARNFTNPMLFLKQSNWKQDAFFNSGASTRNAISSHIILLHPKSRGEITLNSTNPTHYPIINPNYLDSDQDLEDLIWGTEEIIKLIDTKPMKAIGAKLGDNSIPACTGLNGREFWKCRIRNVATGIYHPIGTCRMGVSPEDSVVDNDLIVHGMQNLRVVDASVIPISTSGHTNPVAAMIAEKIADEIKEEYLSFIFS